MVVDPPLLQNADTLLDLYGEDIRARAYVTSDALRGEQMLRPDYTLPVVEMHMKGGAEPARYTYAGEVFRLGRSMTRIAPMNLSRSAMRSLTAPTRQMRMRRSLRCFTCSCVVLSCAWRPATSVS